MIITATYLLHVLAFVCFVLGAWGVSARLNLVALGLALWMLSLLLV